MWLGYCLLHKKSFIFRDDKMSKLSCLLGPATTTSNKRSKTLHVLELSGPQHGEAVDGSSVMVFSIVYRSIIVIRLGAKELWYVLVTRAKDQIRLRPQWPVKRCGAKSSVGSSGLSDCRAVAAIFL
jgi:hypothetical protein